MTMKQLVAEEALNKGFSESAIQDFMSWSNMDDDEVQPHEEATMRADVREMLRQFRLPGLN